MREEQDEAKVPIDFSEETLQLLKELGDVLQGIHDRLVSEGYVITDGEFIQPSKNQNTHVSKSGIK